MNLSSRTQLRKHRVEKEKVPSNYRQLLELKYIICKHEINQELIFNNSYNTSCTWNKFMLP